jgi:hypothetical protein
MSILQEWFTFTFSLHILHISLHIIFAYFAYYIQHLKGDIFRFCISKLHILHILGHILHIILHMMHIILHILHILKRYVPILHTLKDKFFIFYDFFPYSAYFFSYSAYALTYFAPFCLYFAYLFACLSSFSSYSTCFVKFVSYSA